MIYIKKNTINKVVLTLEESSRISNPNYLFIFKNSFIQNAPNIPWMATDDSSYPSRYNLFNLEESSTGSIDGGLNAPLNLVGGQYSYTVFESINPTLEISETTGRVLEIGRMIVATEKTTITNNTNNIYN